MQLNAAKFQQGFLISKTSLTTSIIRKTLGSTSFPPSKLAFSTEQDCCAHHTAVEILVHLAESMWWCLTLAGNNDTDVCDGQRGVRVILRGTPICDVDPLGGGATDISRATRGCGLYNLTVWLQFLLPLKEDTKNHETKDMRIVNFR